MKCELCEESDQSLIEVLFEYPVCSVCSSKMGLFRDKTIARYIKEFELKKRKDPEELSFEEEMERRLEYIEKDYIKKKIKLNYILDRIKDLK